MDSIRNARDLLRFASTHQNYHRDSLVRIPEADRTIHIDCRPCNADELVSHCSLFALPVIDQNRWTHLRLQTSALSEDFAARQPQSSVIPKITLTPGASRFWREPLRRAVEDGKLELAFIAVVQGNGGSAVKKLIVATEYPQFATGIFNEAINGYSVVFTGACLGRELERARDYGPNSLAVRWMKVTSLDQMFEVRGRARLRDESERLDIGVLC